MWDITADVSILAKMKLPRLAVEGMSLCMDAQVVPDCSNRIVEPNPDTETERVTDNEKLINQ